MDDANGDNRRCHNRMWVRVIPRRQGGPGSPTSSSPTPWRTWVSVIIIANTVQELGLGHHHRQHRGELGSPPRAPSQDLRHGHPPRTFATDILAGRRWLRAGRGDEEHAGLHYDHQLGGCGLSEGSFAPCLPPSLPPPPPSSPPTSPFLAPHSPQRHHPITPPHSIALHYRADLPPLSTSTSLLAVSYTHLTLPTILLV